MTDITLQVIASAPDQVRGISRGDIIAVHSTSTLADEVNGEYKMREPITSPRTVFIHVRDVPPEMHSVLTALNGRNHQYRIHPSKLPEGEATVTWSQLGDLNG